MSSKLIKIIESRVKYILNNYGNLLTPDEMSELNSILHDLRSGKKYDKSKIRKLENYLNELLRDIRRRQLDDMGCSDVNEAKKIAKKHAKIALSKLEKLKRKTYDVDDGVLRIVLGNEFYKFLSNYDRLKLKANKIDQTNKVEDCYDVYSKSIKIIKIIDDNVIKNIEKNKKILNILFKIYLMASNVRMGALTKLHSFDRDNDYNEIISNAFKIECNSIKHINRIVKNNERPTSAELTNYLKRLFFLQDLLGLDYVVTATDFDVDSLFNNYVPPVSKDYTLVYDMINELFGNKLYKFPYWVLCAELIVLSMVNYDKANASCLILPNLSSLRYVNYDYLSVSCKTNKICYRDGNTFYSKGSNVTLDDLIKRHYSALSELTLWLSTFSGVVHTYQYNLSLITLSESSNILDISLYLLEDMLNGIKLLDLSSDYVLNMYYSVLSYIISTLDLNDVSSIARVLEYDEHSFRVIVDTDNSNSIRLISAYRIFIDSMYLILSNAIQG